MRIPDREKVRLFARQKVYNLGYRLGGSLDGHPLPPARLVHAVIGTRELAWYQLSGLFMHQSLDTLLRRLQRPIESFGSILDFGCGCGRILRWWSALATRAELWGSDIDPRLVRWCQRRLGSFARFTVNGAEPPLPFDDGRFELVYSYSVFTHLAARQQRPWAAELARVTKPGGLVILTTHGVRCAWRHGLTPQQLAALEADGLVVVADQQSGSNVCGAYHTAGYLDRFSSFGLRMIDHLPGGARDGSEQDLTTFERVR